MQPVEMSYEAVRQKQSCCPRVQLPRMDMSFRRKGLCKRYKYVARRWTSPESGLNGRDCQDILPELSGRLSEGGHLDVVVDA